MNEAWNSDIRLTINTFDEEAVELSTHQEKPGGVVRFTSDPIDLSKVKTLEIVYDAPKKLVTKTLPSPSGPLVYTEEVEQEYMLKRIRLIAHTDPSEFLRGTHSYKVGDEPDAAVPIVLKKGANAHVINLRVPKKIDFSGYHGNYSGDPQIGCSSLSDSFCQSDDRDSERSGGTGAEGINLRARIAW